MAVQEFLQVDLGTSPGVEREGKNWRGSEPGDDVLTTCIFQPNRFPQLINTIVK